MHRVVPELIIENYRAGRYRGEFPAVGMFLDLSGFSTMTDALMQHGQHGAEVLASLMHGVFDPLVQSIFDYGGKIVSFAGDGIMALYPTEKDERSIAARALASAWVIQNRLMENPERRTVYGEFSFSAKIGLAIGSVSWSILRSDDGEQATYYCRGSAVDESADAEHHAHAGEIVLTGRLNELLKDAIRTHPFDSFHRFGRFRVDVPAAIPAHFPPVDLESSRVFMPEEVIARDVRGEFRQIVNLFSRIPDLPEDKLDQFMNAVFELREKYGGLLTRLDFGDKGCNMLMLWGAPVAYENDIGRALNFVLDLQGRVDFPITAGVTYYIAHAGYLGSELCEDYTCYGWGVNLASRFMMGARPGEIWVDERIARRVSRRFRIDPVGAQHFKGFASEQKVNVLRGRKPAVDVIYQGELVGRESELERLREFVEPLRQGRFAGVLGVAGEAGVGKGRLVHEFVSSDPIRDGKALWAICHPDQILRTSFNSLRGWLLRYFELPDIETGEGRKQAFDAKLDSLIASIPDPELAQELDRTRSFLGALVDLYWDGSLYGQLDGEGRYNNTLLALIALMKAESLRQPFLLFMDDFQFLDQDTRIFLSHLKRSLLAGFISYPVALIVTFRRQGASLPVDDGLIDSFIELSGITSSDMAHFVEIILGGSASLELVNLVLSRSEGNPYFAEQIVRYLQEEDLLEMSRDGWAPVKRMQESVLPGDIRAVLVARLDQLVREVKEVVQAASVLGREFDALLLVSMLHEEVGVRHAVQEAEKAAIWAPLNEIRYIFTHGLLRDAAYSMQMQARRQELHALAVDALEQLHAEDIRNHYPDLAYHAEHAGLREEAQEYYTLAGKVSAELFQNNQAMDYLSRALTHTPSGDLRTQFDLLLERVKVVNRLGDRGLQAQDLDSLDELAGQLNEIRSFATVGMQRANYCYTTGDLTGTVETAKKVLAMSETLGDADLALGVYVVLAQALFRLGNLDEAMEQARDGLELARKAGRRVEEGRALSSMGLIAMEQKVPSAAQKLFSDAVAIARETKERTLESRALTNLGNAAAYVQRDYAAARGYYEQSLAIMRELGERYGQGLSLANLGWVCGMQGDFVTARKYHEQALTVSREIGNIYQETYTLLNLSGVAEVQGDAPSAIRYALQAIELSRKMGDKPGEAWSYYYLGYAYLLSGDLGQAGNAFQYSLDLRRQMGQPALATEPTAGLIQLALLEGDMPLAYRLVEDILLYFSEGGTLDGTEEPLRVYLACHLALAQANDPRADAVLQNAKLMLEEQVSKLTDERARRMYVENVPWRLAIERAWLAKRETP